MRIAIMGAGALGAYIGARLHQAGHEVTLIARGAHLQAIQGDGLVIDSPNGDAHLSDIAATDDVASVGVVDGVLVFVKNYDLNVALDQMQPMVGPDTFVATFQNGISAPQEAAQRFGADRVMGGAAWIAGYIEAPGRFKHTAPNDTLAFGALTPAGRRFEQALYEALTQAATRPEIVEAIESALWRKFVTLAATSAVSTLTRLTFGEINAVPETLNLMEQALLEAAAVGRAVCPDLPEDLGAQQFAFYQTIDGQVRASMCTDILNGRRLELDWFSGEITRQARKHGLSTPVHDVALAALWPYRNGAIG